ncbi:polysaccharide deacetylase family protein [bacterium]|nr:polysaccharide deacetylase family protein [bacterium]
MKWPTYRRLAIQAEQAGINRLVRLIGSWRGLLVLTYHRIGDSSQCEFDRGVYSADEATFTRQMEFVRSHFEVVGIDQVVRQPDSYWRNRQAVLITFDDGYVDNFEVAFPVLKRLGMPALFFVTSGFLDQRSISWWDEIAWMMRQRYPQMAADELDDEICQRIERYYELSGDQRESYLDRLSDELKTDRYDAGSPPWMTWEMLREMAKSDIRFGGHTVTHPILTRIQNNDWEFELAEGKRRLEEETGTEVQAFSYPVGNPDCFSDSLMTQTARHYQAAFSCYGGVNRAASAKRWDRFDLQRWPVYGPMRQFQVTVTWPQLMN